MIVLRIAGKASQVFKIINLLARKRGHITLGELVKERRDK